MAYLPFKRYVEEDPDWGDATGVAGNTLLAYNEELGILVQVSNPVTIIKDTISGTTYQHNLLTGKTTNDFSGTVAGQSIYTTDLMSNFNTSTGTITFYDDQTGNRIELIIL